MGERTCSVDGCEIPFDRLKRGMCGLHYQRFNRYGSTDQPLRDWRMCDGPECSRRAGKSGLCPSHYKQRHLGKALRPLRVATKNLGRPQFCLFPDCGRPHKARGFCKAHNDQVKKAQELRPVAERNPGLICYEPACARLAVARRLCPAHLYTHYYSVQRYGLTPGQYEEMHEAQGGVCAICGEVNPSGRRLFIDHDHDCCSNAAESCGRCIRGLLCGRCNSALGQARDNANRLRAMADYLDEYNVRKLARL